MKLAQTILLGVMRIINVAQGALLILAALFTFEIWRRTGLDPLLSIVVTTPLMFGIGWLLYRGMLARVRAAPEAMTVLLTFALAIAIEGFMGLIWRNVFRSVTPSYFASSFHVGGLFLPKGLAAGCLTAVVVLALLYLVLTRTWTGRAIRGAAENLQGAQLVGVRVLDVAALTAWPPPARAARSCRFCSRSSPRRITSGSPSCSASSCSAAWAACLARRSARCCSAWPRT
jgi:branched-chain amino acid transport system permease protein